MLESDAFSDLVDGIYAATLDQSLWVDFLGKMNQHFGGARMQLYGFDAGAKMALGHITVGYNQDYVESLEAYYGDRNVYAQRHLGMEIGKVYSCDALYNRHALYQTEIYNDWLKPQENLAVGAGAVLFRDQTRAFGFGTHFREKDDEKLSSTIMATMQALTPHLQQSFEISRVIARQSFELDLLHSEQLGGRDALFLLSDEGHILHANKTAQTMLEQARFTRQDFVGRFCFVKPNASERLERCMQTLRAGGKIISTTFTIDGRAIPPVCTTPTEPVCRLIKLDPKALDALPFALLMGHTRPCLQLTISFPKQNNDAVLRFAKDNGLTASEIAVVEAVANGQTLAEVADMRQVSVYTVRYQVKSAMSKIGVRRQVDMVRIIEALRNSPDL